MTARLGDRPAVTAAAMVLGLLVCYAFGTAWFLVAYARAAGPIGLWAALGMCVFPFVVPDLVKLALAWMLSRRLAGCGRTAQPPQKGLRSRKKCDMVERGFCQPLEGRK